MISNEGKQNITSNNKAIIENVIYQKYYTANKILIKTINNFKYKNSLHTLCYKSVNSIYL